ncbi:MAG: TetR family transcriptional regulator [Burkholderiales bacterium]|nr:TetR family transcriptional regulator [Burkholderiales bacterium]
MTLYAEDGFDAPLAKIARDARVTPAILQRHFRTKKALIESVVAQLFEGRWKPEWDTLIANRAIPLEQRLARFYTEYRNHANRTSSRLWTRAGLMGVHSSGKFSSNIEKRILAPIIGELRHAAGLPSPEVQPISKTEIELAQILHGSIAFPNTRSHIFGTKVHIDLHDLIPMMIRVYMPGAIAEIKRLNDR